jgi:hypothetical protein
MPRSLDPYIAILEDLLSGRIGQLEFRTRTIHQFDRTDAGVRWTDEWDADVAAALDQMDGDAEVIYPEAPDQSYITQEQLLASSTRSPRRLVDAKARRRN